MKKYIKVLSLVISLFIISGFASVANASTPVLFVASTGSGDNVQVIVTGDSNASVTLYYIGSNSGTQNSYIGTTNSIGYLSTIISTATYGIIPNTSVYAIVNYQTSPSIVWPYNNQTTGLISFSQSNPTLSVGQSMTISIIGGNNYYGGYAGTYYGGGYSNTYYVPYNSSPSTVSTSISGSTLTLTGIKNGSVVIVICDSANNCGPVSVTVGSANIGYPVYPNNNYSGYIFTRFLTYGSTGSDVIELQQILTDLGFYTGAIGGNYGYLTQSAVRRYQASNGLQQTGNVGLSTRNVLNNQSGAGGE